MLKLSRTQRMKNVEVLDMLNQIKIFSYSKGQNMNIWNINYYRIPHAVMT